MRAAHAQLQVDARAVSSKNNPIHNTVFHKAVVDSKDRLDQTSRNGRIQPPAETAEANHHRVQKENLVLMEGVMRRDNNALKELLDRYSGYIFGVCLRVLSDRGDAEEVMIDTFWELWRKPERYDAERGSLVKYLVMMARSRAIDRSRARANAKKMLLGSVSVDDDYSAVSARSTAEKQPIESMLHDEQHWKVRQLLRELNVAQREAIELCFFHGLSHQQTAEILQQPLGTVKTRIRQGLIRMRASLRSGDHGVAA